MDSRKFACLVAAGFLGVGLVGAATQTAAAPQADVIVRGESIDPELQRKVFYGDLNLAFVPGQKKLSRRIFRTASDLCLDLNGMSGHDDCTDDAVNSTDDQVAAAVQRAKRQMAGLPAGPAVAIAMIIGAR